MPKHFDMVSIIQHKRDGNILSKEQIDWMINNFTKNVISPEQMSAMLMAIYLNGMSSEETYNLTNAMINSGERMSFTNLNKTTVDKHSTGGVGDKITLPLMPLVVSYGLAVPQLSGRGLGHTGGTLDKLESISGWRANLSNEEIFHILSTVGGVVCAAGAGLAPADGKMYALRDVTGTVDSIPLIAASIMSKKIAEGTENLVLDVKYGSGAFMKDINDSRNLAKTMIQLGKDAGVNTSALITNMNSPLGYAIGNANEVYESLEVLAGGGPSDVVELTVALAQEMLNLAGIKDVDVSENLRNGKAMDVWRKTIEAQGGNPDIIAPMASENYTIYADRDGYVVKQDALPFGIAAWRLGAGRARKEDSVNHGAGIMLHAKHGDKVKSGDPLYTMYAERGGLFADALEVLYDQCLIGEKNDYIPNSSLIAEILR